MIFPSHLKMAKKKSRSINTHWLVGLLLVAAVWFGVSSYGQLKSSLINLPFGSNLNKEARNVIMEKFGNLPLSFVENRGQKTQDVLYSVENAGYQINLGQSGIEYRFNTSTPRHSTTAPSEEDLMGKAGSMADEEAGSGSTSSFLQQFVNSSANDIEGEVKLSGTVNIYKGQTTFTGIPTFQQVRYKNLYEGIDLVVGGINRQLKSYYVVAPGAQVTNIKVQYPFATLSMAENGALVVNNGQGELREEKPYVYQIVNEREVEVSAAYAIENDSTYTFSIGSFDPSLPLIIDPYLSYASYLGSSQPERAHVQVDNAGNIYIIRSGLPNGTTEDVTVTKLSADGSSLIYSTSIGGSSLDRSYGSQLDASGAIYLAGSTRSSDFPTMSAAQEAFGGGEEDGFAVKLNPSGALEYSTYLGGSLYETADDIAVDASGAAYVGGFTRSPDYPTTSGALRETRVAQAANNSDVTVTKLSPSGSTIVYSTYIGANGGEVLNGIDVDGSGRAHITGGSTGGWPTTAGSYIPAEIPSGGWDGVYAILSPDGSTVEYSTYFGGMGYDVGWALQVDATGNAYVAGSTASSGIAQSLGTYSGPSGATFYGDAFLLKFDGDGGGMEFLKYLGGSNEDIALVIHIGSSGAIYVAGQTKSSNFPTTSSALQTQLSGSTDAFVSKLSASGDLQFSSLLGGSDAEVAMGVAEFGGNIYVVGGTSSTDFPLAGNSFATDMGASRDSFLAIINPLTSPPQPVSEFPAGPTKASNVAFEVGNTANTSVDITFMLDNTSLACESPEVNHVVPNVEPNALASFNYESEREGQSISDGEVHVCITANDSPPLVGTFTMDNQSPTFTVNYTSIDASQTINATGTYPVTITASEPLSDLPTLSIRNPSSQVDPNRITDALPTQVAETQFVYSRLISDDPEATGGAREEYTFTATDLAGNPAVAQPVPGAMLQLSGGSRIIEEQAQEEEQVAPEQAAESTEREAAPIQMEEEQSPVQQVAEDSRIIVEEAVVEEPIHEAAPAESEPAQDPYQLAEQQLEQIAESLEGEGFQTSSIGNLEDDYITVTNLKSLFITFIPSFESEFLQVHTSFTSSSKITELAVLAKVVEKYAAVVLPNMKADWEEATTFEKNNNVAALWYKKYLSITSVPLTRSAAATNKAEVANIIRALLSKYAKK